MIIKLAASLHRIGGARLSSLILKPYVKLAAWRMRHTRAKKLASDTIAGKIWWSHSVPASVIRMVFLPVSLSDTRPPEGAAGCYGYDEDAIGGRGINGYPMLSKAYFITSEDMKLVEKYHRRLAKGLDLSATRPDDSDAYENSVVGAGS